MSEHLLITSESAYASELFLTSPDAYTSELSRDPDGMLFEGCMDRRAEVLMSGESHLATVMGPGASLGKFGNYQIAMSMSRGSPYRVILRREAQEYAWAHEPDIHDSSHDDCGFRKNARPIYTEMLKPGFITTLTYRDIMRYAGLDDPNLLNLSDVSAAVWYNFEQLSNYVLLGEEKRQIGELEPGASTVRTNINEGVPILYILSHSPSLTLDRQTKHEIQQLEGHTYFDAIGLRLRRILDNPNFGDSFREALLKSTALTSAATASIMIREMFRAGHPVKFVNMHEDNQELKFSYPLQAQNFRDYPKRFPWLFYGGLELN